MSSPAPPEFPGVVGDGKLVKTAWSSYADALDAAQAGVSPGMAYNWGPQESYGTPQGYSYQGGGGTPFDDYIQQGQADDARRTAMAQEAEAAKAAEPPPKTTSQAVTDWGRGQGSNSGVADTLQMFSPTGVAQYAAKLPGEMLENPGVTSATLGGLAGLGAAGGGIKGWWQGKPILSSMGQGIAGMGKSLVQPFTQAGRALLAARGGVRPALSAVQGLTAASPWARALPGVGLAAGVAGDTAGAITGNQGYLSDNFWGQMLEQAARTTGGLVSGAKLGPWGLATAGASTLANLGANTWRAGSAVNDALNSGASIGDIWRGNMAAPEGAEREAMVAKYTAGSARRKAREAAQQPAPQPAQQPQPAPITPPPPATPPAAPEASPAPPQAVGATDAPGVPGATAPQGRGSAKSLVRDASGAHVNAGA